jgi:hypothetical protein
MAVVKKRHSRNCPAKRGKRCSCHGGYRAEVYSPRDEKKIRKTFTHRADAQSWAAEVKRGVDLGTLRAPTKRTLGEAAAAWLAGAEPGRSATAPAIATSPRLCAAIGRHLRITSSRRSAAEG